MSASSLNTKSVLVLDTALKCHPYISGQGCLSLRFPSPHPGPLETKTTNQSHLLVVPPVIMLCQVNETVVYKYLVDSTWSPRSTVPTVTYGFFVHRTPILPFSQPVYFPLHSDKVVSVSFVRLLPRTPCETSADVYTSVWYVIRTNHLLSYISYRYVRLEKINLLWFNRETMAEE